MDTKLHALSKDERESLIEGVKGFISDRDDIVFAYLFGTFLHGESFEDIDIAVFLKRPLELPLKQAIRLADELWRTLGKPAFEFDVKILNSAPLYFQYEVIRSGVVLCSRDEAERVEYEATLASDYLDYKPTLDFFDQELLAGIG